MEPIGSTYSFPQRYDIHSGRSRTASGFAVPNTESNASRGTAPGNNQVQQGFQSSGVTADEFRPYSNLSATKEGSAGNTEKPQLEIKTDAETVQQDPQVQAQIAQLKAAEEKVKAHEAAHKSAGGTMTGPVSYSYTRGPDGRNYITGGEVPISVSPGKTPQETIRRMQQVIQAALAPADPSPQDRAVAAQAAAQQQEASRKLTEIPAETAAEETPPVSIEQEEQADSITVRDSQRAYGNPAVAKQPAINMTATAEPSERVDPDSSLSGPANALQETATPADTTGFNSLQPLSYYA